MLIMWCYGGMGFGFVLCDWFVGVMGGMIVVDSMFGVGSCFIVCLLFGMSIMVEMLFDVFVGCMLIVVLLDDVW